MTRFSCVYQVDIIAIYRRSILRDEVDNMLLTISETCRTGLLTLAL